MGEREILSRVGTMRVVIACALSAAILSCAVNAIVDATERQPMSTIIQGTASNITTPLFATVTALANNGSGAVRVTTSAPHLFGNGDTVNMSSSLLGTAQGEWVITVIDATHFDLVGSTFVSTGTGSAADISLTPPFVTPTDGDAASLSLSGVLSSFQNLADRTQYLNKGLPSHKTIFVSDLQHTDPLSGGTIASWDAFSGATIGSWVDLIGATIWSANQVCQPGDTVEVEANFNVTATGPFLNGAFIIGLWGSMTAAGGAPSYSRLNGGATIMAQPGSAVGTTTFCGSLRANMSNPSTPNATPEAKIMLFIENGATVTAGVHMMGDWHVRFTGYRATGVAQ